MTLSNSPGTRAGPGLGSAPSSCWQQVCFEMQKRVKYHTQSQARQPFRPCVEETWRQVHSLFPASREDARPQVPTSEQQGKRFCKHARETQRGSGPGALFRSKTNSSPRAPQAEAGRLRHSGKEQLLTYWAH